jgi:hypothetical protein
MSMSRAVLSIALNLVGLSAALAQQPAQSAAAAASVFQGLMVDARGMIVGRVVSESDYGAATLVVRQISGIWVVLRVGDFTTGIGNGGDDTLTYWYQSADCTDQAYLPLNPAGLGYVTGPVFGTVATVPPAAMPTIYFAGTPVSVVEAKSARPAGQSCVTLNPDNSPVPIAVGPPQSVPVGSLGLTLPFSIK